MQSFKDESMPATRHLRTAAACAALVGCASAKDGGSDAGGSLDASMPDTGCGTQCDQDFDGVIDSLDQCANSSPLVIVNMVGCAESQLPWTLQSFPPFNLTWTPTGDPGRAGGLTWTYVGIEHGNLFHIDWIICDDPAPCGVSLDGPVEAAEAWQFDATNSDLPGGKVVFTNTTHIALEDATMPQRTGRLTVTIVDAANAPVPCASVGTLTVSARQGTYGAEILGTAFTVKTAIEIQDPATTWTPYLDYYDAAPTATSGLGTAVSFGGSFYAK